MKNNLKLFFLSLSILSYELLIIRLLSLIFEYELLFIIISLSILGLGIGGIFYHSYISKNKDDDKYLKISYLLFPLSFIFSIYVLTNYFHQIKLGGSILVILIPLLLGGTLISSIFAKNIEKTNLLYFFDLLGAAFGCILSLPAIQYLGGVNSIVFTSVIASVSLLFKNEKKLKFIPLLVTSLIFVSNVKYNYINFNLDKIKKTTTPLGQVLNYPGIESKWVKSSWDIYSRCDVVKASRGDIKRSIFINGGTQATMMRFDDDPLTKDIIRKYMTSSIVFFPYIFDSNEKILNIGSGGGRDVLMALMSGAREITAVEINKGVISMVNEFKDYNGDIYNYDNVKLFVEDGRTFIMHTEEKYDRIVLSLASTFAFSDASGLAQMENYLYTEEAFGEFLSHLTEDGTLVIFVDFPELLEKFIMTSVSVLGKKFNLSEKEAMTHIAAFETVEVSGYGYLIMVKGKPYSRKTIENMHNLKDSFSLASVHTPFIKSDNDLDLIAGGTLSTSEYIANNSSNLKPSKDDSPFFLEVVFSHRIKLTILFFVILSVMLMFVIFFQASIISRGSERVNSNILLFVPYFIFIGTGFMLVEILLTKRFSFYLGFPHLNLAVILSTILVGTGLGSLISGKIKEENKKKAVIFTTSALILLLLTFETTNSIFIKSTISASLLTKSFLLGIYLLPVSMLLGFFFPIGLKAVGKIGKNETPWFWGINGISSVLGSVLSVILSMSYGFSSVLYVAVILYVGAASLLIFYSRNASINTS